MSQESSPTKRFGRWGMATALGVGLVASPGIAWGDEAQAEWDATVRSISTGVNNGYQLAMDEVNRKVYYSDATWRSENREIEVSEGTGKVVEFDANSRELVGEHSFLDLTRNDGSGKESDPLSWEGVTDPEGSVSSMRSTFSPYGIAVDPNTEGGPTIVTTTARGRNAELGYGGHLVVYKASQGAPTDADRIFEFEDGTPVLDGPRRVSIDTQRHLAYVSNLGTSRGGSDERPGYVAVIDIESKTPIAKVEIPNGAGSVDVEVDEENNLIYVGHMEGETLYVIDGNAIDTSDAQDGSLNHDAISVLTEGVAPNARPTYNAELKRLYVASFANEGVINVIDADPESDTYGESLDVIETGATNSVAIDGELGFLYSANLGDREVVVYDTETHEVVANVPTSGNAVNLGINPENHDVWVSNFSDSGVTDIISVSSADQEVFPTLSVSPAQNIDPENAEITIIGTNFDASELSQIPGIEGPYGVYANVGWIAEDWKPSAGAPRESRVGVNTVWVQGNQDEGLYLQWDMNEDGTANFEWNVQLDRAALEEAAVDGYQLAVFTNGAGGSTQEANELAVPISFAEGAGEEPEPSEPAGEWIVDERTHWSVEYYQPNYWVAGEGLQLEGRGWMNDDNSQGSVLGVKLNSNADPNRSVDTPIKGYDVDETVWDVIEADDEGNWSASLNFPTAQNSTLALQAGDTVEVRFLTGSLGNNDWGRSIAFEVPVVAEAPGEGGEPTPPAEPTDDSVVSEIPAETTNDGEGYEFTTETHETGVNNGYQLAFDQVNGKVYFTDAKWRSEKRTGGVTANEAQSQLVAINVADEATSNISFNDLTLNDGSRAENDPYDWADSSSNSYSTMRTGFTPYGVGVDPNTPGGPTVITTTARGRNADAGYGGHLVVFQPENGAPTDEDRIFEFEDGTPILDGPRRVAVDTQRHIAYVTNLGTSRGGGEYRPGFVAAIDLVTKEPIARIPVPGDAGVVGVAVDEENNRIYAGQMTGETMYVIDGNEINTSNAQDMSLNEGLAVALDASIPANARPTYSPADQRVYVSSWANEGTITVVDADPESSTYGQTVESIAAGATNSVTVDGERGLLYSANLGDREVVVYDTTTFDIVAQVPTSGNAINIAIDPQTRDAWVSNFADSGITDVITLTQQDPTDPDPTDPDPTDPDPTDPDPTDPDPTDPDPTDPDPTDPDPKDPGQDDDGKDGKGKDDGKGDDMPVTGFDASLMAWAVLLVVGSGAVITLAVRRNRQSQS